MEDFATSVSASSLICQEDGIDLDAATTYKEEEEEEEEEEHRKQFTLLKDFAHLEYFYEAAADDEKYIESLLKREGSFDDRRISLDDASFDQVTAENWFVTERSAAIKWVLKTRGSFGFGFRTAFLAIAYLDRFFLRRSIDKGKCWAIRLLSVACLSLAAKMEECRVPALSEFEIGEYRFDGHSIQRMELLVLTTLDWRMNMVTPFEYLSYFATKLWGRIDNGTNDLAMFKVNELIFASIDVISVVDYRPSAIGAAAVLAASTEISTEELIEPKINSINLFGSLEKEDVYSCFSLMREEYSSKKMRRSTPNGNSSIITKAHDAMESLSFTSSRNKRRKL